jgi:hypothetical protein
MYQSGTYNHQFKCQKYVEDVISNIFACFAHLTPGSIFLDPY